MTRKANRSGPIIATLIDGLYLKENPSADPQAAHAFGRLIQTELANWSEAEVYHATIALLCRGEISPEKSREMLLRIKRVNSMRATRPRWCEKGWHIGHLRGFSIQPWLYLPTRTTDDKWHSTPLSEGLPWHQPPASIPAKGIKALSFWCQGSEERITRMQFLLTSQPEDEAKSRKLVAGLSARFARLGWPDRSFLEIIPKLKDAPLWNGSKQIAGRKLSWTAFRGKMGWTEPDEFRLELLFENDAGT